MERDEVSHWQQNRNQSDSLGESCYGAQSNSQSESNKIQSQNQIDSLKVSNNEIILILIENHSDWCEESLWFSERIIKPNNDLFFKQISWLCLGVGESDFDRAR